MEYIVVLERTFLFYILITVLYRFMGKREVGQLGIVDLIVSILIAELAAMSIDKREESIFLSIIPIVALVLIQIGVAYYSLKNSKARETLDGVPSVIIKRGIINFKEMVKQRYNIDDLLTQLREQHIRSIEEVDYAILETSGNLSVFKKQGDLVSEYPMPVVLDGEIIEDTLKQIGKNKNWIEEYLEKEKTSIDDVFYAFYRKKKLFLIRHSDVEK